MDTPAGLVERRLLSRDEREQFQYEIVRFHLEDLNALAERQEARGGPLPDGELQRVAAIIQAARWDRDGFLIAIRRFVDEGRAEGADAFGPALLLPAIGAGDEPFLATVPPALSRLAAALRADCEKPAEP
jgi:hypothetical protein